MVCLAMIVVVMTLRAELIGCEFQIGGVFSRLNFKSILAVADQTLSALRASGQFMGLSGFESSTNLGWHSKQKSRAFSRDPSARNICCEPPRGVNGERDHRDS